jgi:hypothetical protein
MRERAQQELGSRELMPQRSLKLFQIRFHSCLAQESFSQI